MELSVVFIFMEAEEETNKFVHDFLHGASHDTEEDTQDGIPEELKKRKSFEEGEKGDEGISKKQKLSFNLPIAPQTNNKVEEKEEEYKDSKVIFICIV